MHFLFKIKLHFILFVYGGVLVKALDSRLEMAVSIPQLCIQVRPGQVVHAAATDAEEPPTDYWGLRKPIMTLID